MSASISRRVYAGMYGPTTGDRIRLADGELLTCAPADVLPLAQRYLLF